MKTYHNYTPVAHPGEMLVPVPGWGMRAHYLAGGPRVGVGSTNGLGYDFVVGLPIVGDQHINLPVEKMANDAVAMAWPPLQTRLEAEFPKLITQAEKAVVTQLWPQMQPKFRAEIDRGLKEGKKTAYTIGAIVALSIFAAAWWVKKGK